MKNLLYLLFAICLIGCGSNSSEEIIDIDAPRTPEYYNLLFRKNYETKFETGLNAPFGDTGEYGFKGHKSIDTLLIDLNDKDISIVPPSKKGAYEYVNYIKVINYSSNQNSNSKITISRDFYLNDCPDVLYKNCEPNGVFFKKGNDIVAYNESNISEDQLDKLTNVKFFEKIKDTMHYWLDFTIGKQPFDEYFPDGLNVGDVVDYQTIISYTSNTSGTSQKLPYTVFKVEPVYE